MDPRIVLLEYGIAKCDINIPQERKKMLVKHPPVDVRGGGSVVAVQGGGR